MTYKEIVYMCLDELKIHSDDAKFTEDHVIFLAEKYRAFLLSQRYKDIRKHVPESNYQTIHLDLEEVTITPSDPYLEGVYIRSIDKVPSLMSIGNNRVYPIDFYIGEITLISRERMRYVGHNKYLSNIIYCSIGPDGHLYFKSCNPKHMELNKVHLIGVFENSNEASELQCTCEGEGKTSDIMDREFPIEDSLVPPLLELLVKELGGAVYNVEDENNNANDDLARPAQ